MSSQNRYCCRCLRTTKFEVRETVYTCTCCGVVIDTKDKAEGRSLIGNPMRSYKTSFAA